MRIVVTHTDLRLYWLARLSHLARRLESRGDELVVVEVSGRGSPYDLAGRGDAPGTGAGPKWLRLFDKDIKSIPPAVIYEALCGKLDELDPAVVLAGAIAFPPGAAAVRWCRNHKKPVIIMDDARLQDVRRSRLVNFVKRRFYRNADAALIPAGSHRPSYLKWGMRDRQIFYGVDVVDNDWFSLRSDRARSKAASLRKAYGLPRRFFLGAGRQIPEKNWPTLLDAYRAYRSRNVADPWGLVLMGDGPDRRRLQRQGRELASAVKFLPFLSQEKLCDIYALCGALVLPSYGETWGLVVNEAMACGLPVLVSDQCGCARTLVEPGINGWTFSPDDPEELALLMETISAGDQAELAAMGRASKRTISQWSLERFAQGAIDAITHCKDVSRGFVCSFDKLLLPLWKGRYRPT